jgi:DNA-binding CsgD family transcriptional regulator
MAPSLRVHPEDVSQTGSRLGEQSEPVRIRPTCDLVAWRLDVGEDAYALLEWPQTHAWEPMAGRLTSAEREVARMMAAGLSNVDIAASRGTSPRTVANQAGNIFRKLAVRSRLGLYALLASGSAEARRRTTP